MLDANLNDFLLLYSGRPTGEQQDIAPLKFCMFAEEGRRGDPLPKLTHSCRRRCRRRGRLITSRDEPKVYLYYYTLKHMEREIDYS